MNHFILLSLMASLLFISCGDSSTTPTGPDPIENDIVVNINDASVFELNGESTLTFQVRASDVSDTPIVVDFETQNKTAEAGVDYIESTGQVTIAAGQRTASIEITVLEDDINEVDEQIEVSITSTQSKIGIGTGIATGIIRDNDDPIYEEEGYTTSESFAGYEKIWGDEFDGDALDMESYTFEMGDGCPNLCGWGNNELQRYTDSPENAKLEDGKLVITAIQEDVAEYSSSRIITKDKKEFKFGRIDIRAKLPEGQGIWPAFWMLGANIDDVGWPATGEIDIMEMIGNEPNVTHGTAHWGITGQGSSLLGSSFTLDEKFSERFHVFSLVWEMNSIDWYVDETKIHSLTDAQVNGIWRFNEPFFLIFNIAVGGNWPGSPDQTTVFPQRMEIDYIRVFQ